MNERRANVKYPEIKITKINNLYIDENGFCSFTGVHFKIDGEDYFLYNYNPEMEPVCQLYKGRMKCRLQVIDGFYGSLDGAIRFKRKPRCLKYVDTDYFYEQLVKHGLINKGD